MTKARGSFAVTSWHEDPYEELEGGGKLTRASVEQTFTGDISGDGAVQWLMSYRSDGTARFVGLQRVRGSVGDRSGSFVLETAGDFDGNEAKGTWSVVAGSGTAGLTGLRGAGMFRAPKASFELDYEFA
jgi:hypothetical protein